MSPRRASARVRYFPTPPEPLRAASGNRYPLAPSTDPTAYARALTIAQCIGRALLDERGAHDSARWAVDLRELPSWVDMLVGGRFFDEATSGAVITIYPRPSGNPAVRVNGAATGAIVDRIRRLGIEANT